MADTEFKLDPRVRDSSSDVVKAKIQKIAEELARNRYMAFAIVHAALSLYDRRTSGREDEGTGLHRSSDSIIHFLEDFSREYGWKEILNLREFAEYTVLRRIVIDEYQLPSYDDERSRYFLFMAMLLIYLVSRAENDVFLRRKPCFGILKLFQIDKYLDEAFSTKNSTKTNSYTFPKSQVSIPNIGEVLKAELHIENPSDPSISAFFNIPPSSPARYVCYRYTTQIEPKRNAQNQLTKSFIEIDRPRDEKTVYSFTHKYLDVEDVVRTTSGFVIHLAQTFYFVGGSLRGRGVAAVGAKFIAVPASDSGTWYEHDFMSGLFLSNDSALNAIVGRFFMARTDDGPLDEQELKKRYCGRIPERNFFSDIKSNAANPLRLHETDRKDFLRAMSIKTELKKDLETTIVSFRKK
jgi:hypothetical protein